MNNKNIARIWGLSLVAAAFAFGVPAVGVADSVLYAIDSDNDVLSIVDPVTGVEQSTLGFFVPGDIIYTNTGLAVDPTTNKVYAAIKLASVAGASRSLVELNLETGEGTVIGNMGQSIASIAFTSNGTLYAVSGDCNNGCGGSTTPETLYTVNLNNGALTFFKTLGNGDDGEAIAFNPVDGMLYHMSGRGAGLIFEKINLTTGAITNIPLSGGSYIDPDLEAIAFTFDPAQHLFVGSLIECGCENGVWSYITLTPNGFLTHVNTLPRWWKGYAFHEEGAAADVFLDLEAVPDVNGAVGAAALVSGLEGDGRSPSIQVFVKDGATGHPISQMTVLNDNWRAVDMTVAPASGGNAQIVVLARRFDGKNLVVVHRADNGNQIRKIQFFNNNWVALAVAYVPKADGPGPGGSAFAVVARNSTDNRVAVQLRRRSDGSLIRTIRFFGGGWEPIDMVVLDDISGNDRPEIALLGHSDVGKIVAIVRDAGSQDLINNIRYFSNTVTPRAITVVGDVGGGPDPELAVLGVKPAGRNIVQLRDAASDVNINNIYYFGSNWTTLDLAGLADVNGNSSADTAVLAQSDTGTIRVNVRDAATGLLIRGMSFLDSSWSARAFAVIPDIDGNGVQELGVVARKDDGSIRVQIRDAASGSIVRSFNIP